jgi:hypothetical protein
MEIVIYMHIVSNWRGQSIKGARYTRIVLVGTGLGKQKFRRRRWREFDVIDAFGELRDQMLSL